MWPLRQSCTDQMNSTHFYRMPTESLGIALGAGNTGERQQNRGTPCDLGAYVLTGGRET